jgi:hypothetical protein
MLPQLLEAIQNYTRQVEQGPVRCPWHRCPHCGRTVESFTLHDRRKREFLVVVGRLVQRVLSWLTRWRCPRCQKRLTLYPDFALPYKRYVRGAVFHFSTDYLAHDERSYRQAVEEGGMAIFYEAAEGEEESIDERTLAPSTLHRWIGSLAALPTTVAEALGLIRAQWPSCGIFRQLLQIVFPSHKYRSEKRRLQLQEALTLLTTETTYQGLFKISIFPHLATHCRWG